MLRESRADGIVVLIIRVGVHECTSTGSPLQARGMQQLLASTGSRRMLHQGAIWQSAADVTPRVRDAVMCPHASCRSVHMVGQARPKPGECESTVCALRQPAALHSLLAKGQRVLHVLLAES